MKHHRQQRAQQELGVVGRRIGQHILLDDERSGGDRLKLDAFERPDGGGRGRQGRGESARGDVSGRVVLLVIEDDDLRPPPGDEVALEIERDIRGGEGCAGADRARRHRQIIAPQRHADAGCGIDRLHEDRRRRRPIGIDDDDAEIAHDGAAERQGENDEGDQRDTGDQEPSDAVASEPAQLSCRDGDQPRMGQRLHRAFIRDRPSTLRRRSFQA